MDRVQLLNLLEGVKSGKFRVEVALERIQHAFWEPVEVDGLVVCRADTSRKYRCGVGEVIFGQNKSPEIVAEIAKKLLKHYKNLLITRTDEQTYDVVVNIEKSAKFHKQARCITIIREENTVKKNNILVISAGTGDVGVAEEAAVTAEFAGSNVERLYDVGVAGIHRLLEHKEKFLWADAIVVVAGMDAALASVVGGLVNRRPVIAVPTSVGYGASFHGLSALLAMLNCCAPGVVVVNIDNGFGAGYFATLIKKHDDY